MRLSAVELRATGIQKMALREAVGGTKRQKAGQSLDAGRRVDSGSRTRCQEAMLARAVNGMLEETRRKRRDGEEVEVGPGAAASFGLHLCCDWKWMAGWMDGGMEGWMAGWLAGRVWGWVEGEWGRQLTAPRLGRGMDGGFLGCLLLGPPTGSGRWRGGPRFTYLQLYSTVQHSTALYLFRCAGTRAVGLGTLEVRTGLPTELEARRLAGSS